jgi:hypothetical protein
MFIAAAVTISKVISLFELSVHELLPLFLGVHLAHRARDEF